MVKCRESKKQNKANTNICSSLQPKSFCHWKWLFHVSAFPGTLGSAAAILSIGHYRLLSHSVCIQNEISGWILFVDLCWFGLSVLIVVPEMRSTLGVSVNCIMLLHLLTMKRHSSVHSWENVFFQPPTEFKHICDIPFWVFDHLGSLLHLLIWNNSLFYLPVKQ